MRARTRMASTLRRQPFAKLDADIAAALQARVPRAVRQNTGTRELVPTDLVTTDLVTTDLIT